MSQPRTRAALLKRVRERLEAAGIEDAGFEARQLVMHGLGLSRTELSAYCDIPVTDLDLGALEAVLVRREAREPLSQILGTQPFWTLDLKVTRDVLTPRADTETIVEATLDAVADRSAPVRMLDIATGSGAIALALLSELANAQAVATDISAGALAVARENALRHALQDRVSFHQTSWTDGVEGGFDLVVSNPPYIASAVIDSLDPEVREFEPRLALDGGRDGLDPYPHLFAESRRLLKPGGTGVFEIGYDQGEAVLALAREAGTSHAQLRADLGGRDRAVIFRFS